MKTLTPLALTILLALALPARSESIWLEGESPEEKSSAFTQVHLGRNETGLCASGGFVLFLDTIKEGPHTATYKFATTITEGKFKIWASTTPPNVEWSSHFVVKLDGKELALNILSDAAMLPYGNQANPNLLKWGLIQEERLEPGEHTLTFEINDKRQLGDNYSFFLDAILITSDSVKPSGPVKPAVLDETK
jgi:hypothetical protein